jgi:N-glycosylase/DNA lyase
MQRLSALNETAVYTLPTSYSYSNFSSDINKVEQYLPNEDIEVMPGIKWGNYCKLYTPAFWKYMYLYYDLPENENSHRLGSNAIEEVIACLLGGYGIPSEMGLLAFQRLKKESLIYPGVSFKKIETALSTPFMAENGKTRKYRFYNQKSKYVYNFLQRDDLDSVDIDNDISFRNWLLSIDGIGPKTASWITRNWLQSENVAILDIHILRAGKIAGFFNGINNVSKNYFTLEESYISFCRALEVLPSNMDAVIWNYMKKTNKLALSVISNSN